MKPWSSFLKDVLPKVPGCPEPVAEHAVRRAAQEFFETTRVWTAWLDDVITAGPEVMEYDIELEPRTDLVRLEDATLNGQPLRVRTEQSLPSDWMTYPGQQSEGVHSTDRKTVVLLPPAAADMVLRLKASMKPAEEATGIEDHLFAQYVKQIADGAVAMLKEHTGTTYGDAHGAAYYRDRFNDHMAVADFQRFRGFSSARPRRQVRTY